MRFRKGSSGFANLSFLVCCFLAAGILLFASKTFILDDSFLSCSSPNTFNQNWRMVTQDGRKSVLSEIPRSLSFKGNTLILENDLPAIHGNNEMLCFLSNNEDVCVRVNDKVIYTYGYEDKNSFGNYFGNVWCMIPMDASYSGQKIFIEINARCNSTGSGNYSFYLDHRSSIICHLVVSNLFLLCNCLVGMFLGIALVFSGFYGAICLSNFGHARIYLGACVILATIWAFTYANLSQILFHKKATGYLLNYFSFYLLPIPILLLMSFLLPHRAVHYRRLAILWSMLFFLLTILYITNVIELETPLQIIHILIMLIALDMLFTFIRNGNRGNNRILFFGIGLFSVFTLISLIWFYQDRTEKIFFFSMNDLILIGIDFLVVLFYAAITRSNTRVVQHAEHLKHQAYTDGLTQVGNRAAFELRMDALEKHRNAITMFMIDLNNLKTVNDTLGHNTGDRLICDVVDCLQTAFGSSGEVYRFGGDEFVVLMDGANKEQALAAQERLMHTLVVHNRQAKHKIDVAIGFSSRLSNENPTESPRALLHQADANMYAAKIRYKSKLVGQNISHYPLQESLDPITGLMSFPTFAQRISERFSQKQDNDRSVAVVSFDLNHFNGYNSLYGWEAGNRLLGNLADMALRLCGPEDFCAHGDADVFWLFINYEKPQEFLDRLRNQVHLFDAEMEKIKLFLSFGIYIITDSSLTVNEMCYRASLARRSIKGQFDRLYAFYDEAQHVRQTDKMRLVGQMHASLERNEFQPYYQPQFAIDGKTLLGAEALVRWTHPDGSITLPIDFIELFENCGLLLSLDRYMFEYVCQAQRRRLDQGLPWIPVSVNLSRLHAYAPEAAAGFRSVLDQYGIDPEMICLELTETAFVTEAERTIAFVEDLHQHGFQVAMDDFGSGHSSLGQLSCMHVDVVKFDRSFLSGSFSSPLASDILSYLIDVCHRSGIQTIAEGVETQQQLQFLAECGCSAVQGDFFSTALPEKSFDQLLQRAHIPAKSP